MLSTLLSYILLYKYAAIFVMTFLGGIALPIPSGSAVAAAAAFATQGYFNFYGVLFSGLIGYLSGDSVGYWLVRLYGLRILRVLGLSRFLKQEKLDLAREKIDEHPILTIYFSRFFTAVGPAVNVACGLTRLSYRKFLLFDVLGELSEITCYGIIGYYFGSNWQYFTQLSGEFFLFLAIGALVSFMFWRLMLKKR